MAASKARISNNQYKDHKAFVHANAQITYFKILVYQRKKKKTVLLLWQMPNSVFFYKSFLVVFYTCVLYNI